MLWEGVAEGKYQMMARRADKVVWQHDVVVDDSQRLAVTVTADAVVPLALELACVTSN